MKNFKNVCAQGDIIIVRVDSLPENAERVNPEGGQVIVTHSETGHHHVMEAERVTMYRLPEEIYECFLVVESDAELVHLRSYDTHEPIAFKPGTYRVRRQREYTAEGFQRVED